MDRSVLSSFFFFTHKQGEDPMKNKDALTEPNREEDNTNNRRNLHRNPDFQAFLMKRPYSLLKDNRKKSDKI